MGFLAHPSLTSSVPLWLEPGTLLLPVCTTSSHVLLSVPGCPGAPAPREEVSLWPRNLVLPTTLGFPGCQDRPPTGIVPLLQGPAPCWLFLRGTSGLLRTFCCSSSNAASCGNVPMGGTLSSLRILLRVVTTVQSPLHRHLADHVALTLATPKSSQG